MVNAVTPYSYYDTLNASATPAKTSTTVPATAATPSDTVALSPQVQALLKQFSTVSADSVASLLGGSADSTSDDNGEVENLLGGATTGGDAISNLIGGPSFTSKSTADVIKATQSSISSSVYAKLVQSAYNGAAQRTVPAKTTDSTSA